MIEDLINKNAVFLQNYGVEMNSDNDIEIYKYGLRILYFYLIDISVIFSIAYCFNKLYETAIMTFIFAVLQVFGGGYHAKTPLRCLLTMIIGAFVGNIFMIVVADMVMFNITAAIVISGFILMIAPVTNKNHPVSKKVFKRANSIIRLMVCLILFMILLLTILNKNIERTAIIVTLELYLISLIIARIKYKKR